MPLVTLTDSQMAVAIKEAERRMEAGRNQTSRTFTGITLTQELKQQIDLLGAVSEMAVSLYLKLPWTGKGKIGASDVDRYEVRSSQRKEGKDYYLYIREYDKDAVYIYCVVDGPKVVIAGWATAADVRTKGRLLYEDNQCYGLPRQELYAMETLR
ncbi:hypothetical protein UFOVP800_20 [uncultured Caudovirales phage]|uniref:Uncharacterized protein n=1 Tax=uncultured Caudovirales phage TaxID=2100421 RepID=A0A6J5NWG8_9CAUD|nr:hypothetical protein UFOVP800_20 [uncultured Caudovirales phage]